MLRKYAYIDHVTVSSIKCYGYYLLKNAKRQMVYHINVKCTVRCIWPSFDEILKCETLYYKG